MAQLGLFAVKDAVNLPEFNSEPDLPKIKLKVVELPGLIDERPELVEPTAAFFVPKVTSNSDDDCEDRQEIGYAANFFLPQESPTQIIDHSHRC